MTRPQTVAGAVDGDNIDITEAEWKRFCDNVRAKLILGGPNNFPFPCMPEFTPQQNAARYFEELCDRKKFPKFKEKWYETLKDMAFMLNPDIQAPALMPIMDITFLGPMMGIEIPDFTVPELLGMMATLTPMTIATALEIPELEIQNFIAEFALIIPQPPPIPEIPSLDLPGLQHLFDIKMRTYELGFKMIGELIANFPIPPTLDGLVKVACDTGVKANIINMTVPLDAAAAATITEFTVGYAINAAVGAMIGPGVIMKNFTAQMLGESPEEELIEVTAEHDPLFDVGNALLNNYLSNRTNFEFRKTLVEIAKNLELDPNWISTAIVQETGGNFDPTQRELNNDPMWKKGVGLLQWEPDPLGLLAPFTLPSGETINFKNIKSYKRLELISNWSAVEQLYLVEATLARTVNHLKQKFNTSLRSATEVYITIHYPAAKAGGPYGIFPTKQSLSDVIEGILLAGKARGIITR